MKMKVWGKTVFLNIVLFLLARASHVQKNGLKASFLFEIGAQTFLTDPGSVAIVSYPTR